MTAEIVALDLETTGLDTTKDKIVQIGAIKFDSKTFEIKDQYSVYIKPTGVFSMNPVAIEKTGLTDDFINKVGVSLPSVWEKIREFIGNCDILTYNGNHFDIPMLYSNLKENGLEFDFEGRTYYDAMTIERKRFSMKLENTYKRYTGNELTDAHDALADVKATIAVFEGQQKVDKDVEDETFTMLSPEGFIKYNDKKELVFTTGKYKDIQTNEVCISDPSYIRWIFNNFSDITKKNIVNEYKKMKELEKK